MVLMSNVKFVPCFMSPDLFRPRTKGNYSARPFHGLQTPLFLVRGDTDFSFQILDFGLRGN
jgi:hypothetical protein